MSDDAVRARIVDMDAWEEKAKTRQETGDYHMEVRKLDPIGKLSGHVEDETAEPTPVDAEPEAPPPNPPPWKVAKNNELPTIDAVTADYLAWLRSPDPVAQRIRLTSIAAFRTNVPGGAVGMSDDDILVRVATEEARRSTQRVYRDFGLERPVVIG